ncbi:DNA replication and repair protein RecF, partial [Candidatus Microgenomates bacterium]|nr:DNA replication and repair protein RecF [Candidatus Microgenomates bacterium]
MFLKNISLQNFRSYTKSVFKFSSITTLIVGPNTSGKTNLIEGIMLLSTGKSFRAKKENEIVQFHKSVARAEGGIESLSGENKLTVVISDNTKRYLVNGVGKRRVDFAGILTAVLFSPLDLDIIVDSPGLRRDFMDSVLEPVDREYRVAIVAYQKALRQRNALLERTKETGFRQDRQFEYWDNILIENGTTITKKREQLLTFFNNEHKEIFDFAVFYDKSIISRDRLAQYKEQEVQATATLVGPHRDNFSVHVFNDKERATHDVSLFGSRGQQRLVILQLKLLSLNFMEKSLEERPILVLDDIFSELDEGHIKHVLTLVNSQQT